MNKCLLFFFASVLLLSLLWIVIVPIWHTPDEQSHFGQVAFIAETGRMPNALDKLDLTEEIYISEELLGTKRDNLGNNKFTFHPEYRIEYIDSFYGKYEASISALSKTNAKNRFVLSESSRYPILYYYPAALIYRIFYNCDLFTRVYAVRIWSLILFAGTIFFSYKIGKLVFPKNSTLPFILVSLVGFQPMMVFANIGVNSDALGNFIFTLFLYSCMRLIIKDLVLINILLLSGSAVLSIQAKPHFIIILPIISLLFFFLALRGAIRNDKWKFPALLFLIGITIIIYLYKIRFAPFWIVFHFLQTFNFSSYLKFTWEYTLPHAYREVMPWYWGIFDWLGVTYPRIIHRIINWTMLVSMIGFGFWIFHVIRNNLWKKRQIQGIFFLLTVGIVYFVGISLFDWLSWYTTKYQLGVQGRYFFPIICVHMLVVIIGWSFLIPKKWRLKLVLLNILTLGMVLLNFYALYTVSAIYYQLWPITTFIKQASQYKPLIIKGNVIILLFIANFIFLILFFQELLRSSKKTKNTVSINS